MIRFATEKEFWQKDVELVLADWDYKIYKHDGYYIFYIPGNRKWYCSTLEEAKKFGEELFGSQNKQFT